jgi:hypothetical protein
MNWLLIIMLVNIDGGVAVRSVPGFVSEKQCMAAADAVRRSAGDSWRPRVMLSCVGQGYWVDKP